MRPKLASIQDSAEWLIKQNDEADEGHEIISESIRNKVTETFEPFNDLSEKVDEKQYKLTNAYARQLDSDSLCKEVMEQLAEIDTRVVMLKPLSVKHEVLQEQIDEVSSLEKDISRLAPLLKRITDEKRKEKTITGKEKDVDDEVKDLTERKHRIDELLKSRRSEIAMLEPAVKGFDETAEVLEPVLKEVEEKLCALQDVPTDETKCEKQKIEMKVNV